MAEYRPDYRAFAKFMKSQQVHKIVNGAARNGANFLRSIAPVDEGNYKSSISVESGLSITGDRVAAFVVVNDASAAPMELGNKHIKNPPKPLGKMIAYIESGGA